MKKIESLNNSLYDENSNNDSRFGNHSSRTKIATYHNGVKKDWFVPRDKGTTRWKDSMQGFGPGDCYPI